MEIVRDDPAAEFTLLVPATPVQHLLTWWEGERYATARENAERASRALEAAGVRIVGAVVGDASPIQAISDELARRAGYYGAIIICTFPAALSRWLRLDLVSQARRSYNLPVIHVEGQPEHVSAKVP
jgi:hypothetical protein